MKAIIYENYGGPEVLKLKDIPKPEPKSNELLVRIHASTINYGDVSARNFKNISFSEFNMPSILLIFAKLAFGISKPKTQVLGSEFSGEIEAVGNSVTKFKTGDPVFGYTGMKLGAHAEYVCISENGMVALKPKNRSHEEASALPYGGIMALELLKKTPVGKGQKVLVNGASGAIGSAAIQILKFQGAEVTGVCSADRMSYVKALGADFVLDYSKKDYLSSGKKYDLIFDILGKLKWSDCKKLLTENGKVLFASFKTSKLARMLITGFFGKQKVICALAGENQANMETLKNLAVNDHLKTIIDRIFPLEEAVKAHDHYENKLNKGHVILKIQ